MMSFCKTNRVLQEALIIADLFRKGNSGSELTDMRKEGILEFVPKLQN
jgi:hypothetical protein